MQPQGGSRSPRAEKRRKAGSRICLHQPQKIVSALMENAGAASGVTAAGRLIGGVGVYDGRHAFVALKMTSGKKTLKKKKYVPARVQRRRRPNKGRPNGDDA
jgi:hypothetical protein